MTQEQLIIAGEAMYRAVNNYPCRCQHNVLYAGMRTAQFVTEQCARCRCMAAWRLLVGEVPVEPVAEQRA